MIDAVPSMILVAYVLFRLLPCLEKKRVLFVLISAFLIESIIVFFIACIQSDLLACVCDACIVLVGWYVLSRIEKNGTWDFALLFLFSMILILFLPISAFLKGTILVLVFMLAQSNQHFMKKSYEENAAEIQNRLVQRQVNEVNNIYKTMRGWRHDYHNHLQSLKAYLKMGEVEKAFEYLDELEKDLDHIDDLVKTGNVNLDAVLNSKLSLALQEKIEVNYKASVPAVLAISDLDLCVLIGNLIDNAVEACQKMDPESKRFIRLYIGIFKKQLYISVTNTTKEIIRKPDEEYITTKRGNHGHGLKRITDTVEKYDGYINRKNEPGYFVTEIMLPL